MPTIRQPQSVQAHIAKLEASVELLEPLYSQAILSLEFCLARAFLGRYGVECSGEAEHLDADQLNCPISIR
jgi:hypothetical protein